MNGGSKLGDISQRKAENLGTVSVIYVTHPDGNIIELQHWDK
jgi:hypothetical protein